MKSEHGYIMSESTYSRVGLAHEQLEDAISLFLDKKCYASAISLAGAAEEVFGMALVRRGEQAVLDWKFKEMAMVHKLLHGKELERKFFVKEENRIRNALKHFKDTDNLNITTDLKDAACWMLVRACENARKLGFNIARFEEFDNWFYENIVGIQE
jgi:hypothetical protein